jgi:hypothetical protein
MSAELTARARGGRKSGHVWAARSPAHADHTSSLSISEAHDGKALVRCHAGCDRDKVIHRLSARGVWPEQRSHWPWLLLPDLVHGRSDLNYIDRSEVALVLGLASRTLAKLRLSGNGPPYRKPGRRSGQPWGL